MRHLHCLLPYHCRPIKPHYENLHDNNPDMNAVVPLSIFISTFLHGLRDHFVEIDAEATCYVYNGFTCRSHRMKSKARL